MQHLNYCRQAIVSIQDYLDGGTMPLYARTSVSVEDTIKVHQQTFDRLLVAVKFALPDFGVLIEDPEFRGIRTAGRINVPFQTIALEYTGSQAVVDASPRANVKTIVLVGEVDEETAYIQRLWFGENYATGRKMWNFVPEVLFDKELLFDGDGKSRIYFLEPELPIVSGVDEIHALYEFWATISFFNALACKNVHIEKSPAKSTKQGKKVKTALPFDDYHFLTVDVPGKAGVRSEGLGGSHRSPREHLRRGHIRRLDSGPIWVNACVVNAGIGSKVGKSYLVRKSA